MKRRAHGLSLLEIIVSIAILVSIAVSMTEVFEQGYKSQRKVRMSTIARLLAQEGIENYSAWSVAASGGQTRANVSGFPGFAREINVTFVTSGLYQVDVIVYWQGTN